MKSTKEGSLSSQVFQKLRSDIIEKKYKENDELKEVALAKALNVSRTPVREALRQLELEGLISMVPNKGAVVTGIRQKDIRDIYDIRALLEGLCVKWAAKHITADQISQLDEIMMLSEYYANKPDSSQQLSELDNKFHQILYEACDSRILGNLLKDYHQYVQLTRTKSIESETRATAVVAEHRNIINAIKNGDGDSAENYAKEHILKVIEKNKQYW